jgi:hypothetical protein
MPPGFYLKQGWEVAARIECEPPGHIPILHDQEAVLKSKAQVPKRRLVVRTMVRPPNRDVAISTI